MWTVRLILKLLFFKNILISEWEKWKIEKVFLTVENIDFYTIKEEKENY